MRTSSPSPLASISESDFRFDLSVGNNSHVVVVSEQVGIGLLGIDDLVGEFFDLLGIGDNVVLEFIQQRVVQGKAPSWIDLLSSSLQANSRQQTETR
jgi:hypothetical protein